MCRRRADSAATWHPTGAQADRMRPALLDNSWASEAAGVDISMQCDIRCADHVAVCARVWRHAWPKLGTPHIWQ